jgi:hypothetical protein
VLHLGQLVVDERVEVVVADQLLVRDAVSEPTEEVVGDHDHVAAQEHLQLAPGRGAAQLDDAEVRGVLPLGRLLGPHAGLHDLGGRRHDGASRGGGAVD